MHLIIDGYSRNPDLLQDEQFLFQLLDRYPAEINMTKIMTPHIIRYIGEKPEDWGLSGIVIIAESHISIHTFVERQYVNIDVFSCKDFDAERVVNDLSHRFELSEYRFRLLDRGTGDLQHLAEGDKMIFVRT